MVKKAATRKAQRHPKHKAMVASMLALRGTLWRLRLIKWITLAEIDKYAEYVKRRFIKRISKYE